MNNNDQWLWIRSLSFLESYGEHGMFNNRSNIDNILTIYDRVDYINIEIY